MRRRKKRRTRKQRPRRIVRYACVLLLMTVAALGVAAVFGKKIISDESQTGTVDVDLQTWWSSDDPDMDPPLDVQLLTVNEYSRPGISMEEITGIVIHYTANPGSSAQSNRDYFENLRYSQTTKASSHFVIGLQGEIIQCIPSSEISYASNDRNKNTLSIECCHPDDTGEFTEETYRSLVKLTNWLCRRFQVDADQVIRHYDITGKNCPKYFVEQEEAWKQFKDDIK